MLAYHIRKKQKISLLDYDIIPKSYVFPEEKALIKKKLDGSTWFIAKDTYGSMGAGIKLANSYLDIPNTKY